MTLLMTHLVLLMAPSLSHPILLMTHYLNRPVLHMVPSLTILSFS
jgi:hypothetical protein